MMEVNILKELFQEGILLKAKVLPAPMQSGQYILVLAKANGGEEQVTKTKGRGTKIYKQLNGALKDAQQIGFKEITVRYE